jgi:hypothetical protein
MTPNALDAQRALEIDELRRRLDGLFAGATGSEDRYGK